MPASLSALQTPKIWAFRTFGARPRPLHPTATAPNTRFQLDILEGKAISGRMQLAPIVHIVVSALNFGEQVAAKPREILRNSARYPTIWAR